jgi:Contractile injection system tube protein/LysM domain
MQLAQLTKATILNQSTQQQIVVMYNPEQFTLEEGNNFVEVAIPGLPTPPVQYIRGKARILSMELFFDTYELAVDVRQYSDQVVQLLEQDPQTQAPPVLVFTMGVFSFSCVLVQVNQRYTMFLRDGTPVRAALSVKFQEYAAVQVQVQAGFFFLPPTVHNIVQGQTASGLAAAYLGNPARWREITNANNIDDPFHLPTGTSIVIPGGSKQ